MSAILVRKAQTGYLEAIVRLHEGDELGGHAAAWGEDTQPVYAAAFAAIASNPDSALFVACDGEVVVGVFEVTLLHSIAHGGRSRVKIEGVQVRADRRSKGIGAIMMAHADVWARERGASFVELDSNKKRKDAHRFYVRHGYANSREGFKKQL
jgi:GNAT superfamily N-acetyltransferase